MSTKMGEVKKTNRNTFYSIFTYLQLYSIPNTFQRQTVFKKANSIVYMQIESFTIMTSQFILVPNQ